MSGPIRVCGEFAKRRGVMRKGEIVQGHAHNFLHTTYVPKGAIRIKQLRMVTEETADQSATFEIVRSVDVFAEASDNWIEIPAGVWHELEALEDSIYDCLYRHRDEDGEIVEHYAGWAPAYQ